MPNVLELAWASKANAGIAEICDTLLQQEREGIHTRKDAGRPSVWDEYRAKQLETIQTFDSLEERTRQKLLQLSRLLLENVHTKTVFTVGLLRDIFISCVYAQPGEEFAVLGEQVADKILHQVQGESTLLETLVDLSKEFPNVRELTELAKRMGAFSGTERKLRPLL